MGEIRRLSSTITNDPQDLSGIVRQAYDLKKSHSIFDFEKIHPAKPSIGRKIGQAVHCLGRLHVAFLTLIRAARRVSGFENLRIGWSELPSLAKTKTRARRKSAIPAWTVAQTFKCLGLEYTDKQARRLMCREGDTVRQSFTRTELVNRFDKLKPASNEVHAEIQLILDLARRGISFSTPFPYIGCSKLSCLLCAEFLASVGSFPTRGCHGKVYDLWTIPEQKGLEQASVDSICSAIKKLETRLEEILLQNPNPKPLEKESTIGGSSVATAIPLTNNQYLSNLIVNRLQNERQHATSAAARQRPSSPNGKDTVNEELDSTTPIEAGEAQGYKSRRDYNRSLGIPYNGPKDPPTCPFDEFWRAYTTFSLPAIFDKFGHGNEIDRELPHLRTFLSCPQQERPLVWRLCHYIALGDVNAAASLPAVEAAAEAFGISPHLNTRDRLQLYEFYGELLGAADPLLLQEAWETGTLLRFSKDRLGTRIDSRVCSLLAGLDISRRRVQDQVSRRKATEAPHQAPPAAAETKKEKLEEERGQEEEKETAKGKKEDVEGKKVEDKVGAEDKKQEKVTNFPMLAAVPRLLGASWSLLLSLTGSSRG
ncbi:hypothetical protein DL771_000179 [Monosporascus sp. 5C6A]|nr:hypothetical protein DL771_000179 [Monosporascus sp. 5C6A]